MSTSFPEIMTPQAVAELLNVHLATVRRMRNRGDIPAYRLGRKIYFRRSEIMAAIEANPVEVTEDETSQAA